MPTNTDDRRSLVCPWDGATAFDLKPPRAFGEGAQRRPHRGAGLMALPGLCHDHAKRRYHLIIVGAGIHEVALAYELALAGGRSNAIPDGGLIRSEFSSPGRR